ncbi:MAG: protoporphyrinogen oxidase [Opitutales bacterium]
MTHEAPLHSLIIGAGISGLSAGWALKKAGKSYKILEKSERPGGPIQTVREGGFVFEKGPNTIQVDGTDLDAFFSELGLDDEIVEANPEANKRYIVRDKTPCAVPMSTKDIFTTKLFSKKAMLSVLVEPFKKKYSSEHDESLADFVRRRLNQEFLDYAINPLIGGIYAGDPETLSVRYGFPKIYNLEDRFGSLIKGSISIMKERKAQGTLYKTKLISFKRGMEQLPQTLAEQQTESVLFNRSISAISQGEDGIWSVTVNDEGGTSTELKSTQLIIACPSSAILQLPFVENIQRPLQSISEIPHPPVTALSLGYPRKSIQHALDGFGMLVPEKEKLSILGCLFSSTLFAGRADSDHVGLSVFLGGTRNPELCKLSDADLLPKVKADLRALIGAEGDPVYMRRTDWPRAIPQYTIGYKKYLDLFDSIEKQNTGLKFIGHLVDGIAVPKCIRSGLHVLS